MNKYIRQAGFSLVELMVALVLGLLISAAVVEVFLSSKNAYRLQDAQALLQENGRFALGFLGNDIRMAGYMGCANVGRVPVNVIVGSPPTDVVFSLAQAVRGENNVGSSGGSYSAAPGTDTLTMRRASSLGVRLAGNMSADNANIQITSNAPGFVQNDIVFISDCLAADLFRITNSPGATGTPITLAHANDSNTSNRLSKVYGPDAEVMAFESIAYFVKATGRTTASGAAINALWVRKRQVGSATAALQDYELVEGVENMQISYGVDTNNDRRADTYQDAAAVSNWERVVSVRLNLLLQSLEGSVVGSSGALVQNLSFNGSTVAKDGRLRQVFTNVIALRNRLP